MKLKFITPALLALSTASSMGVVLIDNSTNNGALTAPVGSATGVNGFNTASIATNTSGRALISANANPATDVLDITTVTDNPGVAISGFTNYRVSYLGGNDAFAFLENGGRLGKPNAPSDGQAFANSSAFVLVSDSHAVTINAGDTINFSFLGGTDTTFDAALRPDPTVSFRTFLLFDGGTELEVTADASSGVFSDNSFGTVSGSVVAPAGATSLGIYIFADATSNTRSLIDDVFLEVVPEPSVALLGSFGLLGLLRRRR